MISSHSPVLPTIYEAWCSPTSVRTRADEQEQHQQQGLEVEECRLLNSTLASPSFAVCRRTHHRCSLPPGSTNFVREQESTSSELHFRLPKFGHFSSSYVPRVAATFRESSRSNSLGARFCILFPSPNPRPIPEQTTAEKNCWTLQIELSQRETPFDNAQIDLAQTNSKSLLALSLDLLDSDTDA